MNKETLLCCDALYGKQREVAFVFDPQFIEEISHALMMPKRIISLFFLPLSFMSWLQTFCK
jgi:hypothetical protein